jgi:lipopolysaccharide export system protein LptA
MFKKSFLITLLSCFCIVSASRFCFGEDTIPFKADRITAELAQGRERTVLSGNAEFISGSMVVRADTIELYGDDFIYALCTGNVTVSDRERGFNLQADKLFYNRQEEITRIQGNAVMEDTENEIVIKGGIIENREKEGIVLIQVGVRILKEDLVCRSQMARYLRDEERLELSGAPVVFWKGDEFRAMKIFFDLEREEVQLERNVEATIQLEEESEEENVE